VTPLVLILIGLLALAAGAILLRSFGPRYRVGRLLAATPTVAIGDAVSLATAGGAGRYVKVSGRIDAEADFEDDAHRPLVFRRSRLEIRNRSRLEIRNRSSWRSVDDRREAVPFQVREGLDGIAVRHADLDVGLVVLPRESVGTAADVPERVPAETDPATSVRLVVQQISSVEHAIVLGVPTLDAHGSPQLSAGLGRPLILTTLESDEAMRVLASDHARRPLAVAIALATGLASVTIGLAWAIVEALL
jgi:hypothetical protein